MGNMWIAPWAFFHDMWTGPLLRLDIDLLYFLPLNGYVVYDHEKVPAKPDGGEHAIFTTCHIVAEHVIQTWHQLQKGCILKQRGQHIDNL